MMSNPQTLRIIMRNGSPLYIYDVVNFRLPHDEDYWVIERSNSNHIFINADEVMVIGFDEDLK
nr:MAG TPA: hypothetical protein [Caudoviricetes sp.]